MQTENATKTEERDDALAIDSDTATASAGDDPSGGETRETPVVDSSSSEGSASRAKKNQRIRRILIGIAVALVAIIAILLIAFGIMTNIGRNELLASNDSQLSYKTMKHDGKTYKFNEDMVSICIIGSDRMYGAAVGDSNGCADAVMVMAYDTSSGKITLINVPRNSVVDFFYSYGYGTDRLHFNSFLATAYAYGNNDEEGSEIVCEAVSHLFGDIPINNYVTLLESAIDPLTEAMGGVTVTAVDDVSQAGVHPGQTYTLTGKDALLYVQYRNIKIHTSPADRMRRQHDFAQAFVKQTIEAAKKDPGVLVKMYNILTDPEYMTTNLDLPELAYLVTNVMQKGTDDLNLTTLTYDEDYEPESGLVGYLIKQDDLRNLLLDVYYLPAD